MKAASQAVRALSAEVTANARLRWGIWLILGILIIYVIIVQYDRVNSVYREYAGETERLSRAETLLRQQDWPELLEAERETHRTLEAAFWNAKTEGLAQAKLQAALKGAIEGLALRKPRIRSGMSQTMPNLPSIWRVQARLDAVYRKGVGLEVLHALATHPKKLIVDRLDIRLRGRRDDAYLTLIVSAYFVGVGAEQTE